MKSTRWMTLLQNQVVALVLALMLAAPALFALPNVRRIDQLTAYGLLGVLVLAVALFRAQGRLNLQTLRATVLRGPNLPVILYAGWCALCAAVSADALASQMALVQLAVGVLIYWMVVYQFRQKTQVQTLLSCVTALVALVVLAAFALDYKSLTSLAGPLNDRQFMGAFLGLTLPVVVGIAAGTKNRVWKISAQFAGVMVAIALLLTGCRSSWIGAAVAMVAFVSLSVLFVWKAQGLARKKHELVIAPVLALVALGLFLTMNPAASQFITERGSSLATASSDDSWKDRVELMEVAGRMVQARPYTGFGPGAYELAQVPFNPNSRHESVIRQMGVTLSESPHNTYLQIAAETGVPGLVLFLGILGSFFFYGVRSLRRMDKGLRQFTLIGCLSAVAGSSIDAIANPGYMFPEVSTFFWLVLGIGMCAAGLGQEVRVEATERATSDAPVMGLPMFLFRGLRTAAVGCCALWIGALLMGMNKADAAFAQSRNRRPTYCDEITRLQVDFLNDGINVQDDESDLDTAAAAFDIDNTNEALEATEDEDLFPNGGIPALTPAVFKLYAVAEEREDGERFIEGLADVTRERRAITIRRTGGLRGITYFQRDPSDYSSVQIVFVPEFSRQTRIGRISFTYNCGGRRGRYSTSFGIKVNRPSRNTDLVETPDGDEESIFAGF